MSDLEPAVSRAASQAVEAVRKRDRRTRHGFIVATAVIIAALAGQLLLLSEAIERLDTQAEVDAARTEQLLCAIALSQSVTTEAVRALAEKFGTELPEIPGEAQALQCKVPGDDVIIGTSGNDHLTGTPEVDFINGLAGNDEVNGRDSNDAIFGEDGNDTLRGNGGNDTIGAGNGRDILRGQAGNDTLRSTENDHKVDELRGGPGNDTCEKRPNDKAFRCEDVVVVTGPETG